jgi:anaerobic selenocysteine-containing dehydrogenase
MPDHTRRRTPRAGTTIETACPLDCPDACSLEVAVEDGRITSISGSRRQPVTNGFICAKVRRYADRVYGEDRIMRPGLRRGPKGAADFTSIGWDVALDRFAETLIGASRLFGGESILPVSYGGSNGLVSQDTSDARLFRRLGTSRLARTVCAAPTTAAAQALYGRMPSVGYADYARAALIVVWGANPSVSGLHLVPYIQEAQRNGAALAVIDPRTTPLARHADLHLPIRPGTDLVVALAVHRALFESGGANTAFLKAHTRGSDKLRERAAPWTFERAAEVSGVEPAAIERLASLYTERSPAVIRCGWGLERNRNGGSAALAVLALPAVAGKFGVRGGGYTMSSAGAWRVDPVWIGADEPGTRLVNMNQLGRALTESLEPPVKVLVVYNCNPAVTLPDQNRVLAGLAREDLYTVVIEQVVTDTAAFADLVLPATTFLESHDLARAYGPASLQLIKPVIEPVGEARPNADIFAEVARRVGVSRDGEPADDLETLLGVTAALPESARLALWESGIAVPDAGQNPVQMVDVFPATPDGMIDLFPDRLEAETGGQLYRYQADAASSAYPLALISPASDRTVTSTLGELPRPPVSLSMHPDDAHVRHLREGQQVRVFNDRGEVRCPVVIEPTIRPGTVALPKGLWRKHTANGFTATALVADTLTDFGGGACFNDARVNVEAVPD